MKRLAIYPTILFLIFSLTWCKLDSSIKTDMVLEVIDWNLPDTSRVSTPFNLTLQSRLENSCIHDFHFFIYQYDAVTFRVYGTGVYENHGEDCSTEVNNIDSTRIITFNQTGKFYFNFLKENNWEKDSIIIIP